MIQPEPFRMDSISTTAKYYKVSPKFSLTDNINTQLYIFNQITGLSRVSVSIFSPDLQEGPPEGSGSDHADKSLPILEVTLYGTFVDELYPQDMEERKLLHDAYTGAWLQPCDMGDRLAQEIMNWSTYVNRHRKDRRWSSHGAWTTFAGRNYTFPVLALVVDFRNLVGPKLRTVTSPRMDIYLSALP